MDCFIGQIKAFPYGFAPRGWALCQGQRMEISQYNALFALIGTKFGGDGTRYFNLPDLRHAEPDSTPIVNCHYYIALEGIFPPRS